MKRTFLFLAVSAAMLTPAFAAMTDEECTAAWVAADTNKDGSLDSTESARYFAALRVAEKPLAERRRAHAADLRRELQGRLFRHRFSRSWRAFRRCQQLYRGPGAGSRSGRRLHQRLRPDEGRQGHLARDRGGCRAKPSTLPSTTKATSSPQTCNPENTLMRTLSRVYDTYGQARQVVADLKAAGIPDF